MPLPDPDDLLSDLDPAQREAVTITSGPLCILAGAGSGKTRVISRRVAYALAMGVVRPRDVLVVTFTDKAAERDGGPACCARASWRCGIHVPRRGAPAAPTFLATGPWHRPPESLRRRRRVLAPGSRVARRLPVPRSRAISPPRSNGRRRGGSAPATTNRGRSPKAATLRCRRTSWPACIDATRRPRPGPAGSTSKTCWNGPSS